MLKRSLSVVVGLVLLLSWSSLLLAEFEKGNVYSGFKLLEKRFVKEVNADCYLFEHVKSGAHLFKIASDDPNKTFSIAFKTIPDSDCGTPHIMEHCVLNGSKHFPVKSPFDVLSKGSLNTFLNAMTDTDITIYPVASMNDKDYFNLMHVYLDAVFYPLIYDDPRIFQQEGWHHELVRAEEPIVYKGVVYNEMLGAFSNPSTELSYHMYRNLFPNNNYGLESGGYPSAISKLTREAFLNFHRRYYHPDNSYIFLYGNASLEKELTFIDTEYLSDFQKSGSKVTIPIQQPFPAMKEAGAYYSIAEGGSTQDQTYLTLSFVIGRNTDVALGMMLNVLKDVLVDQESAPIRLALQEAGVGKEVNARIDTYQQNVFVITVQNANPEDKDRFRDVVMRTLEKSIEQGLDKQAVEGTLNRLEFRLREGDDAQKGLTYNFQAQPTWFFADDPFAGLEYEKPLAEVKKAVQTNGLEMAIKKHFLDNTHALLLVLEPKPGLEQENNARVEAELAAHKETLSPEEIQALAHNTQELIAFQEREDSPEALATIPMLSLADIDPKTMWYEAGEQSMAGIPVLHHEEFTNDVVYVDLYFDARTLPQELIPYAALLAEVLGSLNTEGYEYGALDIALNVHTGGFNTGLRTYLQNSDDRYLIPEFVVSSKSMNDKVEKMFELAGEIVNRTRYDDAERMKTVLTRHQSRLDGRLRRSGLGYAITRMESYYSNRGMFNELTNGLQYYWFVTDLVNQFDQKTEEIRTNLEQTASLLFTKGNLVAAVTCSKADAPKFSAGLTQFVGSLQEGTPGFADWSFQFTKKNEGLQTASKVQYVVKGYDFRKLGYQWSGQMEVLNQILSTDWLQNRIRVIGGAYGGFSNFASNGQVYFASYRDPNLKETLENYDATPGYLRDLKADEKDMTRYIIGTVASIDQPLTPSQRGDRAVQYYFERTTRDQLQSHRNAVLKTTAGDIRNMEKMVADILAQKAFCVYGNEEKIESEKELFGELVKPLK